MAKLLHPAPPWLPPRSDTVILWHGCTDVDRVAIEKAIDATLGRPSTDFGRGFYTTTLKRQAEQWALFRFASLTMKAKKKNKPMVLRFQVPRASQGPILGLDTLKSLHFVRGDYMDEDYWSLVQHCRQSPPPPGVHDHRHPVGGWYDVVSGPVAAMWKQRVTISNSDQYSFHTSRATDVLQTLINQGNPHYESFDVI